MGGISSLFLFPGVVRSFGLAGGGGKLSSRADSQGEIEQNLMFVQSRMRALWILLRKHETLVHFLKKRRLLAVESHPTY